MNQEKLFLTVTIASHSHSHVPALRSQVAGMNWNSNLN